jgi:hypothetical protein
VYFTSQTRVWEEKCLFPTHFAISSSERLQFTDYIWTTSRPYLLMCNAWMRPIKYNHVLLSKQPQFRHKIYEPYLTSRVQEFKLLPFSRQNSKRASRSLLLCNLSYIRDISLTYVTYLSCITSHSCGQQLNRPVVNKITREASESCTNILTL